MLAKLSLAGKGPFPSPAWEREDKLRRQVFKLVHPFIRQADVVVTVAPAGMAVGHLAMAHQVDPGGGQGTFDALGLETHDNICSLFWTGYLIGIGYRKFPQIIMDESGKLRIVSPME